MRFRSGILLIGAIVLAGIGGFSAWRARPGIDQSGKGLGQARGPWPRSSWKNALPSVKYVGDESCARCHGEISATYKTHPMGRSMTRVGGEPADIASSSSQIAAFDVGSAHYTAERREGRVIHRESQSDATGKVLAEFETEVSYALGSGTRGTTYLFEREGRLYQSPISWFGQNQRWDLSPGYEKNPLHFRRPIEAQCLFCHSNQVVPVPLTVNRYEPPIFRGLAIGCERCHGPGELHVQKQEVDDGRDLTIVNPSHLEPSLRDAVCEQCHILGDDHVAKPGRSAFDFRPSFDTSDFFAVFERTSKQETRAVGQVEQMKLSRCYRESKGQMGCTSCHDPHQIPDEQKRVAYYRGKCLECHEQPGCSLPIAVRQTRNQDDCIACHMPAAPKTDIIHVATRDHRVLRAAESQAAAESAPSRPDGSLRLLNPPQPGAGKPESSARELGIAMTLEGGDYPESPATRQLGVRALQLLDRALAESPEDLEVKRFRARALSLAGRRRAATELQQQILRTAPSYEQVLDEFILYAIQIKDYRPALASVETALALNPVSPDLHERLAFLSCQLQDWSRAVREARESLRLDPFRRFARMFLVEALLHGNEKNEAQGELTKLYKLHPNERGALDEWYAELRSSLK